MEALAIFGIACNVMQTINFAHETISIVKRIHQSGSPEQGLVEIGQHLSEAAGNLHQELSKRPKPLKKPEHDLIETARKCMVAAKELKEEVDYLSIPDNRKGFRASTAVAAKAIWRKRRLQRLEKALTDYQRIMETEVLLRINITLDAVEIQQQEGFNHLSEQLRVFIQQYSTGNRTMSDLVKREADVLKTHITSELVQNQESVNRHVSFELGVKEVSLKSHVTASTSDVGSSLSAQMSTLDVQSSKERARERFLGSLKFPGMNARKNQIAQNYPNTCFWFLGLDVEDDDSSDDSSVESSSDGFDVGYGTDSSQYGDDTDSSAESSQDGSAEPTWDSFVDWLESDSKLYWVSGKPGSGKSILMKFLTSRPETRHALQRWRPEVKILSHYLWSPGAVMGRNIKGVWCSLLYQLFVDSEDLIDWILAGQPQLRHKESDSDWDIVELTQLGKTSLSVSRRALCIFIDGLDEICLEDGADGIIGVVNELRINHQIKICVSSRPEPAFQRQFTTHPHVIIHDVTSSDIKRFAEGILCQSCLPENELDRSPLLQTLINTLVERAQGVFLWAMLVAKSLLRGLKNHDTDDELYARLDGMPSDLVQLYYHMWSRLPEDDRQVYQEKAALYFNLILGIHRTHFILLTINYWNYSVLEMMLASDARIQEDFFMSLDNDISVDTWKRKCDTVIRDIEISCAELLEMRMEAVGWDFRTVPEDYKVLIPYTTKVITYFHRTIYDFFKNTDEGKSILFSPKYKEADITKRQFKASLILCRVGDKIHANSMDQKTLLDTYLHCLSRLQSFLPPACINELFTYCRYAWLRGFIQDEDLSQAQDATTSCLKDFMTYVAQYGLLDIMKAHVNTHEIDVRSITTYLFASCSLKGIRHLSERGSRKCLEYGLQTIQYLLERGADPNSNIVYLFADRAKGHKDWPRNYDRVRCAFGVFLISLLSIAFGISTPQRLPEYPDNGIRKTVQLLVEHGADPNSKSPIIYGLDIGGYGWPLSIDSFLAVDNHRDTWSRDLVLVLEIKNSRIVEAIYDRLQTRSQQSWSIWGTKDIRVVAFSERNQTTKRHVFSKVESMEDSAELLEMVRPFDMELGSGGLDHVHIEHIAHRSPVIENIQEYFRELGWCVPSDRPSVSVEDCNSSGESEDDLLA